MGKLEYHGGYRCKIAHSEKRCDHNWARTSLRTCEAVSSAISFKGQQFESLAATSTCTRSNAASVCVKPALIRRLSAAAFASSGAPL